MLCLALTLALALASCSEEDAETEMISVTVKKDLTNVELKATLDDVYTDNHSDGTLYVLALPTSDTTAIPSDVDVVGEVKIKGKITFSFSLKDEKGLSRLQKAFVLAEKTGSSYAALTNAMYIQNPEIFATKQSSAPAVSDIKGLNTPDVYEAHVTGASRILIEVNMVGVLRSAYADDSLYSIADGGIKYNRDGISYFFDKAYVENLDARIKAANDLGMRVYLKTVIALPSLSSSAPTVDLQMVPDISDAEAARNLDAFYAFLAERYSGEVGQVSDYIIGNDANVIKAWTIKEFPEAEKYEQMYAAWLRTAHIALTSVDSNARVYVPVSNAWKGTNIGAVGAKSFLLNLAEDTKLSGNYNWSIALNLGEGEDLPLLLSPDSDDSAPAGDYTTIGVENMQEMSDLIDLAAMRYESEKREFIIDSLALPTTLSESNRAAYYICAYYKAVETGARAFIYSADSAKTDLLDKDMKKNALYYMFVMCGTNKTAQLSDYTAKVDGYNAERFEQNVFKKLTYMQNVRYELDEKTAKRWTAFPVALENFRENDVTMAKMVLRRASNGDYTRVLNISANTSGGMGAVTAYEVDAKDIRASKYIGITASSENRPDLVLVVTSGSSVLYVAQTELANSESEYYFDISELAENVNEKDKLTVSLCLVSDDELSEISISNMALYGSSGFGSTTVIIIIAVVVAALALVALIVFLAVRRKKKQYETQEEV